MVSIVFLTGWLSDIRTEGLTLHNMYEQQNSTFQNPSKQFIVIDGSLSMDCLLYEKNLDGTLKTDKKSLSSNSKGMRVWFVQITLGDYIGFLH